MHFYAFQFLNIAVFLPNGRWPKIISNSQRNWSKKSGESISDNFELLEFPLTYDLGGRTENLNKSLSRLHVDSEGAIVVKEFLAEICTSIAEFQPNADAAHLPMGLTKEGAYTMYEDKFKDLFQVDPSLRITYRHFLRVWEKSFPTLKIPKVATMLEL